MNDSRTKATQLKAMVFDGDGVIFTGRVFVGAEGEVMKERSLVDGQGLSFLRAAGVHVAFITGERGEFLEPIVDKLNRLPSVIDGAWPKIVLFTNCFKHKKVEAAETWLGDIGATWEECGAMGDDYSDYELFKKVGFRATPLQAEKEMKAMADVVAERRGGDGAIRDVVNFILEAKGLSQSELSVK